MRAHGVGLVLGAAALTLGLGACGGATGSGGGKSSVGAATTAPAVTASPSRSASPAPIPTTTRPAAPAVSSTTASTAPPATASPADMAKADAIVQGLLAQIQQATQSTGGGSQPLTRAQAQAIVDAASAAAGVKK